ncbi:MAG TPA: peptidase M20, partial [Armatimonadetes bacterium]|nr:peptidase M20 [Armatimonadota bacterium]
MPDLYDATREVLLTILQIPSAAGREADLAAWVREHLAGLGLSVETDDCHERIGGNCGNLLVRIPGTVDAPAIFFNSHLDTVEP